MKERKETQRQAEAFEYYYSLKDDRSLEKVAKKYKVTERTVKNWSVWFNWQERVVERDKEISVKVAEKVVEQEVKEQLSYLDTTNKLVDKLRVMIETSTTKVETVKDVDVLVGSIERLMRLGLDIQGYTGDTVKGQVETVNSRIKWNTETKTTLYQIKYSIEQLEEDKQEEFKDILTAEMYKAIDGFEPEQEPERLSIRQLITLMDFGKKGKRIHYGPFGCGKTYVEVMALGLYAMKYEPPKAKDSYIMLVAKTGISVKSNLCNPLTTLFGDNFRYDSSKKDGVSKDAVLVDHNIKLVGVNDASAESRFRGANAYLILGDEVSTWLEDTFNKLLGRLRGELPAGIEEHCFEGATNPDSPIHWLKKLIDTAKDIEFIKWSEFDNITKGAKKYYEQLRARYKDNPAYLARYVLGEWAAAEGLVYSNFKEEIHTLTQEQIKQIDFVEYRVGIDFGLNNATAILLAGRTTANEWVIIKEHYLEKTTLTEIGEKVISLLIDYQVSKIYVDPSATALKDKLKELGIHNYRNANNSVAEGIKYVYDLFTQELLFISKECKKLIGELFTYSYKKDGSDDVVKEHDHACDAKRYLLMGERG